MNTIYLLRVLLGGYEDFERRVVRAYARKERAEADAKALNEWLTARECNRVQCNDAINKDWDSIYDRTYQIAKDGGHPLDLKLEVGTDGAHYEVAPLELQP